MELPEIKKELGQKDKKKLVANMFRDANFEIEKHQDLFDRLVELAEMENSHFDDAVIMSAIVSGIFDYLSEVKGWAFDLSKIKLATLFHDIGKSGPADFEKDDRVLIQQLFNTKLFDTPELKKVHLRSLTLKEAIKLADFNNKPRLIELLKSQDIDLEKETLIEFWRRHDDWTYDILNKIDEKILDKDVKNVASSHHLLDGKNPAHIDLDKIPAESKTLEAIDKYQIIILTLVDKYEAFLKRSAKTHDEAIKTLTELVLNNKNIKEAQKKEYLEIIKIIDQHKDSILEAVGDYLVKK